MSIQNLQRTLLDPNAAQTTDFKAMIEEHGVGHLVDEAKREASHLKDVDRKIGQIVSDNLIELDPLKPSTAPPPDPSEIDTMITNALVHEHVGEMESDPDETRRLLRSDRESGQTVRILSHNLNAIADAIEDEHFSGVAGTVRKAASLIQRGDIVQDLRDFAKTL